MSFTFALIAAISLLGMMATASAHAPEPDAVVARSLVSPGDPTALYRVFAKGRAGQPIVLGVIGGSITQGASASTPGHRYPNLVLAHLRRMFPKSKVSLVNAGVGATGSAFACLRVGRDLFSHHPDLVICEFAVNDANDRESAETFEGLTRQILAAPNHPALICLFLVTESGVNAQEWEAKVGQHYHLPMVSYRDAMLPELQSKRLTFAELSPDHIHPNDRGHQACAQFVNHLLDLTLRAEPPDNSSPAPGALPPPLLTDRFDHTALFEAAALKPTHNDGWQFDPAGACWRANRPGSAIEFEIEGRSIAAMYYRIRKDMGQVSAQVDDGPPTLLDAWFEGAWGGYRQTTAVAKDLPAGKHRVKLTLLDAKSPDSTGHEFKLLALGAAGTH